MKIKKFYIKSLKLYKIYKILTKTYRQIIINNNYINYKLNIIRKM